MRHWINQYGGWLIIAIVVIGPIAWLVASESKTFKGVTEQMNIHLLSQLQLHLHIQYGDSILGI